MIESFRGGYSFLSNFQYFEKPMIYDNLSFKTNEHFYQSMKFERGSDYRMLVSEHPSRGLKKYVNSLKVYWREDWDNIKLDVMMYGLRYKFSEHNPSLKRKLVSTGDSYIQEGNYWNDKYWGFCLKTEEGDNHLGKMLMKVRGELI